MWACVFVSVRDAAAVVAAAAALTASAAATRRKEAGVANQREFVVFSENTHRGDTSSVSCSLLLSF